MNVPLEIVSDSTTRVLTLRWPDKRPQQLTHSRLREACACAECRRLRNDGIAATVAPDVSVIDLQTMGYGVQLIFSDGHARGIYPWRYLEQISEA
jgi:DUF971 family protein